ncbi:plastocyanin/azurin family copper-binding protein [Candidatus Nitrososphaera sp. FF02]|uniref:plastocyanin/azurin family copper-binding protein n=1 Tax=Candidatus Nitrososphaera sp. FF02 TaxID=3398226 RepID=UPI0039E9E4F6
MNARIANAVGVTAILAAILLPVSALVPAYAAEVAVSITPGSSTKTTDAYSPNPVEVNVGDTVVWTNDDSQPHTATSGTPSGGADGMFGGEAGSFGTVPTPDATQSFTFEEEGEFPYYCGLHPSMIGTVMVAAGSGGNGGNGGEPAESTATAELDGESYEVTSMSADNSVTGAEIAAGESVTLTFDGPGTAEVTLPKSMVSGSLMVGGAAAEVVNEDDQSTTISVTVPESGEVVITAATVVPEFGVIAALVLAVSLVAVIGFARFKGTAFGLGRL